MRMQFAGVALVGALAGFPALAQEKPPAAPATAAPAAVPPMTQRTRPALVPLKVTVTLSRYQGDKRISSMPYALGVTANSPKATLRMGIEVPVPTSGNTPVSSVSYKSVGTNIDCGASTDEAAPGLFQLTLVVSDSSVGLNTGEKRAGIATDMPVFRNFNSSFTAMLRDGQTTQYTSATDPVTGEVMKIDVTVALMK